MSPAIVLGIEREKKNKNPIRSNTFLMFRISIPSSLMIYEIPIPLPIGVGPRYYVEFIS
ncbi:MAG: hypothetical protein SRB2_00149 [Desulfobacteraceae bacterium Eth-SRB2]|nr:MAG: hypothetical protein SRB2_00149 [Desulfobacteraceae bacterium Eth-SRB2]